jgi:prolyl-tRNA synthetase
MRMSQLFSPTLREVPSEAEIPSHQLMLRAGLMRKTVSGIYVYLPLGYRSIRKVEQIVREEMDRQGGQEILMSALMPADMWRATGRWLDYGNEMFRLTDRGGRDMCLGPTHEELVTSIARDEIRSYRQLPKLLYQIQTKFRDEIRPRFGLMRAREFIMKDLYSFDRDADGLEQSYRKMYVAYCRTFDRCGLHYRIVEADPGAIGGTSSHEYMVLSDIGEAALVFCDACGYAANVEQAEARGVWEGIGVTPAEGGRPGTRPCEPVPTPGVRTIEELVSFLRVQPDQMLKTLIYVGDGTPVAAVVRGDRELNEVKLKKALGVRELELATPAVIEEVTGAPVGFAGPVGLKPGVRIIADLEVPSLVAGVTGANAADTHLVGVSYGRDWRADVVCDLRNVVKGDACPRCGLPLDAARGVEVGHLFKLGTKYSRVLGAKFLDEDGTEKLMIMGCYGIGITRIVAAVIEEHHDDDGIIWPMSIAPYHATVVPVNTTAPEQLEVAQAIYGDLWALGVEAVVDDRDERPGVKFKDADLIGFPVRVTIGSRTLDHGQVEIRMRRSGEVERVSVSDAARRVREIVDGELKALEPRHHSLD